MTPDDDAELHWSAEAAADIHRKLTRKLAELAAGPLEEFDAGLAGLLTATTAAGADAAALVEWRHRVARDGIAADDDGAAEVADLADQLAAVLEWASWAIADDIEPLDPRRN